MATTAELISDSLQQDILNYQRSATYSAIQVASDSRSVSSSNFGVLQKNIVEYDASEASAAMHSQRLSNSSANGADAGQHANAMTMIGSTVNNLQAQMAQIVQLLVNQKA
jgi:hypothetical protein